MSIRILSILTLIIGTAGFQSAFSDTKAAMHGETAGTPSRVGSMPGPGMMGGDMLQMSPMDPSRGRLLFASKGCVVCHSINGVGGQDAPPLDASTMPGHMNPFEFAAKMWRGAEAMIILQREELGEQIEFTGDELADITAFVHHPDEQKKFSESDIPPRIKELMEHMDENATHEAEDRHREDKLKK